MFRPAEIIIEAFIERLVEHHTRTFPNANPQDREYLSQIARSALSRMTLTNAIYSNLACAVHVTQVAEDVLTGRMIAEGDLSSRDWIQFLTAALFHLIGFVRATLPGDDGRTVVINEAGETLRLDEALTDGALWSVATDRSILYVQHYFRNHPLIDADEVAGLINATRWPWPPRRAVAPDSWPGMLLGAQIVAVISDPRFQSSMRYFFMQVREADVPDTRHYKHSDDLIDGIKDVYWNALFPRLPQVIQYLKNTSDGLTWLANMNARVLEVEHRNTDREA